MVSRNSQALDLLLKHGANIHKECVVDQSISSKKLKPLHYLAKSARLNGLKESDGQILEVLKKHKVQV